MYLCILITKIDEFNVYNIYNYNLKENFGYPPPPYVKTKISETWYNDNNNPEIIKKKINTRLTTVYTKFQRKKTKFEGLIDLRGANTTFPLPPFLIDFLSQAYFLNIHIIFVNYTINLFYYIYMTWILLYTNIRFICKKFVEKCPISFGTIG